MNAPESLFLTDVQALADTRGIVIDAVGVKGLRLPIRVESRAGVQPTVAEAELTVRLPASVKGTHMSRFVELMEAWALPLSAHTLPDLHASMLDRLGAERGAVTFAFPYFIPKVAPISGVVSRLDYQARMRVEGDAARASVWLALCAPVTSLCPCSKEISAYGAHNQRSSVTIEVRLAPAAGFDLESLAGVAEAAASCEVYGLLKRVDEKFVTERAYENPKFVEDLVRDIALALDTEPGVGAYVIDVENHESIHNHAAYARISRDKADRSGVTRP